MSETIDQAFEADNSGPAGGVTPLDDILDGGAADVTASTQERESSLDGDGDAHVPLIALKRERERRRKMDARVQELEDELQRYNDQKWGLDADEDSYAAAEPGRSRDDGGQNDPVLRNYNDSLKTFTSKHGQGEVAAVDAALKRLTPSQQREVVGLVSSSKDPVSSIHAYVKEAGLLGFKPLSLQEVLDGKGKQPSGEIDEIKQQVAGLSQREQSLHAAERRAIEAAARSEFVSDFGRQSFVEIDGIVAQLIQSNHPAVGQLREVYQNSPRPAYAVAQLLHEWGVWSPSDNSEVPQQRQQQPASIFPSNFSTSRNVSHRRGPAWTGPTPLTDIFDRSRKAG